MSNIITGAQELVPIDSLVPHPKNRRRGNIDKIRKSIRDNGFWGSVAVQAETRTILAGYHRWEAAKLEGLTEIPVTWHDVDDAVAYRMVLDDNHASDAGTYDFGLLLEDLRGLDEDELNKTLYDQADIDELMRVTGQAGREAAAFLDGLGGPGGPQPAGTGADNPKPAAGHDGWVAWSITLREEDRGTLLAGLNEAKTAYNLATAADALLVIVNEWRKRRTEETP